MSFVCLVMLSCSAQLSGVMFCQYNVDDAESIAVPMCWLWETEELALQHLLST